MSHPTPLQTLAVRLALSRFRQHYPCPRTDHHEWNADCEEVAWLAVLEAATHCAPDDTSTQEIVAETLWDAIDIGHGTVLSEAERADVAYLARYAENALKQWWRREHRYYSRCVALAHQDDDCLWLEQEIADERALEALQSVEARVDGALLWERLRGELNGTDWAIVQGVLAGKTQQVIAQELGISQQAVSKRIARIRAKVEEIQGKTERNKG